jgi:probable phosphoglycerate mutase
MPPRLRVGARATIDPDLMEWNCGAYEGVTSGTIHASPLGWQIFRDGAPGGETPEQVGARVDRVIARALSGKVAFFAHGHVLRVLAARWVGFPHGAGEHFLLNTLCIFDRYRGGLPSRSGMGLSPSSTAKDGN